MTTRTNWTSYNARIAWTAHSGDHDHILDAFATLSPVVTSTDRDKLEVVFTLPAADIQTACLMAIGTAQAALPDLHVLAVEVMPTSEYDTRYDGAGTDTISVTEAAELLNITRQGVRGRIRNGILPATRVGRDWRIPVGASMIQAAINKQ